MNGWFFQQVLLQNCELVFALSQESDFSERFYSKVNRKRKDSSKKRY